MPPGVHHDPEEAQFRVAEGRPGAAYERCRGYRLYSGRGAQPPGTFRRVDPGRQGQGPPRRTVPHHTRKAGFRWCPGQTEVAVEVRSKTTQIAFPDRHEAVPAFPGISAGTGGNVTDGRHAPRGARPWVVATCLFNEEAGTVRGLSCCPDEGLCPGGWWGGVPFPG